jgi:hypothetical protein
MFFPPPRIIPLYDGEDDNSGGDSDVNVEDRVQEFLICD